MRLKRGTSSRRGGRLGNLTARMKDPIEIICAEDRAAEGTYMREAQREACRKLIEQEATVIFGRISRESIASATDGPIRLRTCNRKRADSVFPAASTRHPRRGPFSK